MELNKNDNVRKRSSKALSRSKTVTQLINDSHKTLSYKTIMLGRFEDCPSLSTRMIKIFLSSTFADMGKERNVIMKYLYPQLRLHCRQKYGIEFQILDMRWGVPSDTQLDHRAPELCFQEIINCKQISCGIYFITIVGHRYGTISLPFSIKENDFKRILSVLQNVPMDTQLFEDWYILDSNNNPPIYTLKAIPIASDEPTEDEIKYVRQEWSKTEDSLTMMLTKAIDILINKGEMNMKDRKKFCSSITEQEIEIGICDEDRTKVDNCAAAFIREITDIESHLDDSKVTRYIDVKGEIPSNDVHEKVKVVVDEYLNQIMRNIIDDSIKKNLSPQNIRYFETNWTDMKDSENDGVYINNFKKEFVEVVKDIIDKNMKDQKDTNDDLYNEVLQHSISCVNHVKHFQGRSELIESVKNYILGDSNLPFIVYGESGCGKTSILAKSAYLSKSWLDEEYSSDVVILLRFLGTSPGTSNIRQTIRYLCRQCMAISGEDDSSSKIDDFKELLQTFYQTLDRLSEDRKIIIFLDSLDQLQPTDGAFTLSWLVTPLRPNVKMILSTLPQHENILHNIRTRFEDNRHFLEVKNLEQSTCMDILLMRLREKERTITTLQKNILTEAFKACSLPIYVNLVYKSVLNWRSYHTDPTNELALKYTVREAIFQFFKTLEKMFNKIFVRHSLAYITASRNGLSEAELEDILSLDNLVLRSVFIYHLPPQIRVPPFLWSRIRQEIGSYLVEREADNCRVLYWYHRQFIEVAKEYLLKDKQFKIYIHDNMADYFLGTYSNNKPKRFYYPPYIVKKMNLPPYTDEGRNMPNQPFCYNQEKDVNTRNNTVLYNFRKINELPWHLANAGRLAEFGDHIAFNYDFLIAKLRISSRSSLLEDLYLINDQNLTFQKSLTLLYNAIRLSTLSLSQDPSNISFDLVGRLSKYCNDSNPRIADLLEQCRRASHLDIGFIPNGQCLESGSGLLHLWYDIGLSMGLVLPSNELMTVSMVDNTITYYDVDGNILKTIPTDVNIFMALKLLLTRRPSKDKPMIYCVLRTVKKINKSHTENEDNNEETNHEKMVKTIYELNIWNGKLTEIREVRDGISDDNIMDMNEKYMLIDSRLGMAKLWNYQEDRYVYELESGVIHACLGLDDNAASVLYKEENHEFIQIINLRNEQITSVGIHSSFNPICCYNMHFDKMLVMLQKGESIYFFRYELNQDCLQHFNTVLEEPFKQKIKRVKICSFHDSNIVIITIQLKKDYEDFLSVHGFVYKSQTDSVMPLYLNNKTLEFKKHTKTFGDSVQCVISEDEELLICSGDKCILLSWSLIDGSLLQVITMGTAEGLISGVFANINKVALCHFPDESSKNTDERMYILEKLYNIDELKKPMNITETGDEKEVDILEEHLLFDPKVYKYRDISNDSLDGLIFVKNSSNTVLIDTFENHTIKSMHFPNDFLNISLLEKSNDSKQIVINVTKVRSSKSDICVISEDGSVKKDIYKCLLDSTISTRINPQNYFINEKNVSYGFSTLFPGWIISFHDVKSNNNSRELDLKALCLSDSSVCTGNFSWNVDKLCEEYNDSCLQEEFKISKLKLANIVLRNNHQNQVILMYRSKDRKYDEILKSEGNRTILWSGVIIILEITIIKDTNNEFGINHNMINFTVADIGNGLALLKDGKFGINYKLEKIDLISGRVIDKVALLEDNSYILYPFLSYDDRFVFGTKWIGPYRVYFSINLSDDLDDMDDMFAILPPRTIQMFDLEKGILVGSYPFENEPETIIVSRSGTLLSNITVNEPIRCIKLNLGDRKDVCVENKYIKNQRNRKKDNKDHGYLKIILTEALREVVDKRPADPIHFLATYLLHV